ncbi:MAG: hypothetical protein B6D44_14540 [Ignavibacteriales bacterium UTCHB2]|jgi:hypothetical protein|nr:MAG: hypothetical protein BWY38_02483 [Ignavibacteria bacterium ADurb.Bin266]OQY70849.1 MAG: hypothetical protein B6D44_14540 [Ignavibacteriales bacterium UTCHB2]HQI41006.1 T9SS type A sorting domain-containing protein [Ignavibacteriaceae bacterium]HQJ45460.1 T9SS type A sorting domain-containing protein [Ignavibacteriaceae bacterium]
MKIYLALAIIFISFVVFAYSGLFDHELLGGTQLNGNGCVCHTTEIDTSVAVWIEGPDTLMTGEVGLYKMFLAKGPAEAGGYNVAGRFGIMSLVDSFSVWDDRAPNELTQAFPLVFPTPQDTIYWAFAYTAPDSVLTDTLYSCGLSIVYDSIPDARDRWNFGPKFPVTVIQSPVPVELVSFNLLVTDNDVTLTWATATETNNAGFEIERNKKLDVRSEAWQSIGFIAGTGTITKPHTYSYIDKNLSAGNYQYRLKQIDLDGTFQYSKTIEAEILSPNEFVLEQNYPNPFNPVTKIRYSIPTPPSSSPLTKGRNEVGFVTLKVYDILGNEVATLVNEYKPAGTYEVEFQSSVNSHQLASGVYYYQLKAGEYVQTKKMIYLK